MLCTSDTRMAVQRVYRTCFQTSLCHGRHDVQKVLLDRTASGSCGTLLQLRHVRRRAPPQNALARSALALGAPWRAALVPGTHRGYSRWGHLPAVYSASAWQLVWTRPHYAIMGKMSCVLSTMAFSDFLYKKLDLAKQGMPFRI